MKKTKIVGCLLGAALVLGLSPAIAAGFLTNGLPPAGGTQYPGTVPFTGNETIPADTNLPNGQNPASESVSIAQLNAATRTGVAGYINALRGGDFGQNLFQRGTSASGITTSPTYGPDGWAISAGTSTSSQWSQQTGAGDIAPETTASLRVQRTSGQTGVVPVCVSQVLTTPDSQRFQGHRAVFQANLQVGANFSATGGVLTATIAYGTGANGTTANFLTGAWTGYAVAGTANFIPTTTFVNGVAGSAGTVYFVATTNAIPVTAQQVGVKICYTPVGTAGTNDWFEMALAELAVSDGGAPSGFDHLPASIDYSRQLGYFYQVTEAAAIRPFIGQAITTAIANIQIQFPELMWKAPAATYTAGTWAVTVAAGTTAGTCTGIASVASTLTASGVTAACTTGGTALLAGNATQLLGVGTSGILAFSAEL